MKRWMCFLCLSGFLPGWMADQKLGIQEQERIEESWSFPQSAPRMEVRVDNIDGPIKVLGQNGRTVHLTVVRTIRAESQEGVEAAKQEVKLRITEEGGVFEALVDAPWRHGGGVRSDKPPSRGYRVAFDFEIRVPKEAHLFLRTINEGDVEVEAVNGDFDVKNINGGIEILEAGGSGSAYALNGDLKVLFSRNPQRDSYFGSLNGEVDLYFLPGLSADLRLKTFNGQIYTDFPANYLPGGSVTPEIREGRFVYKSNDFFGMRVGRGGPEIKLDGFNGDIRIHERGK